MCSFVADTDAHQLIFAHAHHVLPDRLIPCEPHHLPRSKYKKGINSKVFFELSLNRSKIVRQLLGPRTVLPILVPRMVLTILVPKPHSRSRRRRRPNDKKTTLTSDNASTHSTLPPTLHATSMFYCEQLAGGTFKTEQAIELVDDLASLLTRKRKKKKTPHSDDPCAF